ncbi:hypothetical protein ASPBRDRAFT_75565 [Aspergillus brasiliensis CBS 101740]|uniref:Uncharacterized protein n=1 Tax=Aspergillus brasiliensis (strain CBS 101740 / IMI 381727 / IBT 21946) TaxID=767769 RepID=A0A1L9UGZ0_ASPBC|nr:hypothetical protein ASPBRDRAFT_75565 [Aspergillus brasiliensis CBS 101740]
MPVRDGVVSTKATDPGKRKAALGELGREVGCALTARRIRRGRLTERRSIPSPEEGEKKRSQKSHDPAVDSGASLSGRTMDPKSDTCLIGQGVGVPGPRTVGKRHSIAIRPIIAVAELGWANGKDDVHGSSAGRVRYEGKYAVCTCIYGIQSISVNPFMCS